MYHISILRIVVFSFGASLAVRAQSTSSFTSGSLTTSIDSSPDAAAATIVPMKSIFVPTVHNDTQSLEGDLYVLNNSLVVFNTHNDRDYPSYYNEDMWDIDNHTIADLSLCIMSCVDYTVQQDNDKGPICTGVAYIDGYCWRKNGISEDSEFYTNDGAVSAIMHLFNIVPLN